MTSSLLARLHLTTEIVQTLSPELRDQVLTFVKTWGQPTDRLELVTTLREAHGPLLFLLDYEAEAHLDAGDYAKALEVIERRQRRSTTVASQALEAVALLAAGYEPHAQAVADDISVAHPRNHAALRAAALVYTGLGRYEQARAIMEAYLDRRPNHLAAILTIISIAQASDDQETVNRFLQRLGVGIPAGISDTELAELSGLIPESDAESSAAVQLELERRRQLRRQELSQTLAPFTAHEADEEFDVESIYRHLSGPESIEVSREEQRQIQLDAVRHFGFMKLRGGQVEVIASVQRGESILTVMPTGAGKSLCYQLPALTLPRATLVISPLIALMKDQVDSLPAAARQKATFINSSLTDEELAERMNGIAQGDYKLIYAAPERLRQRSFLTALRHAGLDLFVVDEAHCVSLWGHDFRPDYLFVQEARHALGNPPSLAMTATAPPRVRDEIVDYLSNDAIDDGDSDGDSDGEDESIADRSRTEKRRRPKVMTLDIFRPNLHLSSIRFHNEDEKLAALLKFAKETEGSGIIYVNSRRKCESLATLLRSDGIRAEAYHAGLADRGAVQDRFMNDKTRVVVATIAFGMGIDKSDIRFIVHFHPPRSLAAYYQEVGRAGRDGVPSQGVLFYSNNDWANLRRWAKSDEMNVDFLLKVYIAVANQLNIKLEQDAHGDVEPSPAGQDAIDEAPLEELSGDFSDGPAIGPVDARRLRQVLNCDETTARVAVSLLERADLLSRSFDIPREVEIRLPRTLPAAALHDKDFTRLQRGLSLAAGRSGAYRTEDIAAFMDWWLTDVEAQLLEWEAAGFLTLKGAKRAMLIELAPLPEDARERLERLLAQSSALGNSRIDNVIGYATSDTCRHGYISAHFGSPPRLKCDVCDNCTGIRPEVPEVEVSAHPLPDDSDIEPMILDCLVSLPKPVGRSGLARVLAGSLRSPAKPDQARHHGRLKELGEATIMNYIDDLLEDNRLRQYPRNGYPVLAATVRGRARGRSLARRSPGARRVWDAGRG